MTNIKDLENKLRDASKKYYTNGTSPLTDAEFDFELELLKTLDPTNPFIQEIGSDKQDTSHWEKSTHTYPLGSLSKCQVYDEFEKFYKSVKDTLVVEEKMDGISIALTYKSGKLFSAVTRGDGKVGEDITRNVKKMKGIPVSISCNDDILVIRGEIVFKVDDFNKLPEGEYKNPRNAAAGIAKGLDGQYCELLSVVVYSIMTPTPNNDRELVDLQVLKSLGFEVVPHYYAHGTDDVLKIYNDYINDKRAKLQYDIDGLVLKTYTKQDNSSDWEHPANQIAWKFPHQSAITNIENIEWSMSGGHLTPVAVVKPVKLAGVTITRASLSNIRLALEKKIGTGAKVEISRRNDVIPYIEKVIEEGHTSITAPTTCPVCNGKVDFQKNSSGEEYDYLICTNLTCPSKIIRTISKWMVTHNTKGIADSTIEELFNKGIIKDLKDFLSLPHNKEKQDAILKLDGFGEKKLITLLEQILTTKKTTYSNFFTAMNFTNISRKTIDKILAEIGDVDSIKDFFMFVMSPHMNNIAGIGPETIATIRNELNTNTNYIVEISTLVVIEPMKKFIPTGPLLGKSFCFTGSLNTMGRTQAEGLVKTLGGTISGINKNLTYLVTNDPNSGSSKNEKAKKYGTKVINEDEFIALTK
jgi:DNA ligase (NAD+)